MKTLELKEFDERLDYKSLITGCIHTTPKEGYDVPTMIKLLKIDKAVSEANGILELEDADADELKRCVNSMKWTVLHEFIVQFHKDVGNM